MDTVDLSTPVFSKLTKLSKPAHPVSIRKTKRDRSRRFRRKRRRRIRCVGCSKGVSFEKSVSQEICETVEALGITDMEYEPAIKDVSQWQYLHQLAHWKSRAISLEYENKMLHEHIRRLHQKQVEDYQELVSAGNVDEVGEKEEKGSSAGDSGEMALPPKEQPGKSRREEMDRLYGRMAPKICGMETAVQLNYDYLVDKHNPPYWPNLPLKL